MDVDEIVYNAFYLQLRDKFRKKYEFAIAKCWTICVPCGNSLRGLDITDDFVDHHVLKPHPELTLHYTSTDPNNSNLYKFEDTTIRLLKCQDDEEQKQDDEYNVTILSIEKGYNKEFHMYNIFIVDKPLHHKYIITERLQDDNLPLNRIITCYKEAVEFLNAPIEEKRCSLEELRMDLRQIQLSNFESAEELSSHLQELTRRYWASTMRKQSLDLQRDARYQKLLSTSLEVFMMHHLHDEIYSVLSDALEQDDVYVKTKIDQLIYMGVTPDQLGASVSMAISLPAAIVELATLDAREGPLEKLLCLKSTLELIVAEIKGALADIETKNDEESADTKSSIESLKYTPSTDDLIPLVMYVIVKARPMRIVTDLHYINNFLWSISPHDGLSYSLITFKTAISALFEINSQSLPSRSYKVKTELPIGELFDVITGTDKDITPLDRQIHQLATMLEKSTQNHELLI
ncbi:uncharacterized protein LOC107266676 isoform X2 [Cephus cinctus]|uniref:Uncharacterized protein LOC107266676 isoform X2 n=1 Tax=Cephus cinctus TaxID=211228 RepID=A0AAJ7BT39_CEPCN|nr:uncharacterized protein LOC107266676 isoform X2 [Cephus cinctus]